MFEYLAHSARDGCPEQTYEAHIRNVYRKAAQYAEEAEHYANGDESLLASLVRQSALLHDLGKLEDDNQAVLSGETSASGGHLPINHVDAGSAALLKSDSVFSALVVYSHHQGLPNMQEKLGDEFFLRDKRRGVKEHTDKILATLVGRHNELIEEREISSNESPQGNQSVFLRMALSCLADADHFDTAQTYQKAPMHENLPKLRPLERLAKLDCVVSSLGGGDERSRLRAEMYEECRDASSSSWFSACDSPVGTGKTFAVMAHLLKQAAQRGSRRIFVVLPYTSIIGQSVSEYRKALVLPGEDPEQVVAELHHRADFQNQDVRYLTALWRAPIIVTTAVAFFETLASNKPSSLRRLHELPGSVIFIDEAHNALPLKLLPLSFRWMDILSKEWGCYWVLGSGSLVRYWELKQLGGVDMPRPSFSELVKPDLRNQLMQYEQGRVQFAWTDDPLSRQDLIARVFDSPGPRLLIVNTVQTAAVIANDIYERYGSGCVEHLSTALTSKDREVTIDRVKERLSDSADNDWVLVATSCVEAGVDFSFRTGFRELASLLSLLQAAGRVNRGGSYSDSFVLSFALQDDSMLKSNPTLDTSREILKGYFKKGVRISPELSTRSMDDELIRDDSCMKDIKRLFELEDAMEFKTVEQKYRVIDSDTVLAVVDKKLAKDIRHGGGDWKLLQKNSVSIRKYRINDWDLSEISGNLYSWTLRYDSFIGYMRGVLDVEEVKNQPFFSL